MTREQRTEWYTYGVQNIPTIYDEAIRYEGYNKTVDELLGVTSPVIFKIDLEDFSYAMEDREGPYLVLWQTLPLLGLGIPGTNYNFLNSPRINQTFYSSYETQLPFLEFVSVPTNDNAAALVDTVTDLSNADDTIDITNEDIEIEERLRTDAEWSIESQILQPIFDKLTGGADADAANEPRKVVGYVHVHLDWISYFDNLLPEDVTNLILVLSSTCTNDVFTYEINGPKAIQLGKGDLHSKDYDNIGITDVSFVSFSNTDGKRVKQGICIPELNLSLYPSKAFEESFYSQDATYYMIGVIAIFAFTSLVFIVYDVSVRKRQNKVMARIVRQDRIVSNVFPVAFRDRLYAGGNGGPNNDDNKNAKKDKKTKSGGGVGDSNGDGDSHGADVSIAAISHSEYYDENHHEDNLDDPFGISRAPLAELYPSVTVVYAGKSA